ncbi:MAG: hypothetical protein R3B09_06640 [Nannocystaceae bacterium]
MRVDSGDETERAATSTATESTTSTTTTTTDGMSATSVGGTTTTGTTTTAGETSASSSDSESHGCFLCPPDGGPKCVPVDPGVWEPCTVEGNGVSGVDSCDKGAMCWEVNPETNTGIYASGDMGVVGDPCEFINVCDPGTFCGNPAAYPGCDPNAGGCCIPFCSLKAPDCVGGTECQPWFDEMKTPPGYEDVGA